MPSGVIPSDGSVTVINDYAFFGCSGLGSVTVPGCVSQIGAPMENEIKVTVNTGFFAWLFAAIRDLFGIAQPVREFNP